jgi:serine/threonine protein kinase
MYKMHTLERRLQGGGVVPFCFLNPLYYESIETYAPRDSTYKNILASLVNSTWKIIKDRTWYAVVPGAGSLPKQGFKIHIAATSASAEQVLFAAVPILLTAGLHFKVVVDAQMLDFMNSKHFPRGSSGKFITVYPPNESQFRKILEELHAATATLDGPFILSDRPYKESKVLFYRYGGFVNIYTVNIYGEKDMVITHPDKSVERDVRVPYFRLPRGVEDPFASEVQTAPEQLVLKDRYQIVAPIVHSNAGGVYRGLDLKTGKSVIVKEARPFSNYGHPNLDAVSARRNECRTLRELADTGYVPALVDYFSEWKHEFLVEEWLEGTTLARFRADSDYALVVNRSDQSAALEHLCKHMHHIASGMLSLLATCHSRGVILCDISSDNVLISGGNIKVIDLENACFVCDRWKHDNVKVATPGFASRRSMKSGIPVQEDDYYALGTLLFSQLLPTHPFFELQPDAKEVFLRELIKDKGIPQEVYQLITALWGGDVTAAKSVLATFDAGIVDRCHGSIFQTRDRQATEVGRDYSLEVQEIAGYLLKSADYERHDRLWPADYRVYSTNPLSIAYGALGIAPFIARVTGQLPQAMTDWILARASQRQDYAPGLYIGLAGVAYGLFELGHEELALNCLHDAGRSPLLFEAHDMFYGSAGVGMASLHMARKLNSQWCLDLASKIGDQLIAAAQSTTKGYCWRNVDGGEYYGFAHGGSGIALFLLYLSMATNREDYRACALGAIERELAGARVVEENMLVWNPEDRHDIQTPYWKFGNAGIGSVLIRFYHLLGDDQLKQAAVRAACYVAIKYSVLPAQFNGLSGIGEFLLDMHRVTGEVQYLRQAYDIASTVLLYRVQTSRGIIYPGEELFRCSADFGTGSAGIGMFFRRLTESEDRFLWDIDIAGLGRDDVAKAPAGQDEKAFSLTDAS